MIEPGEAYTKRLSGLREEAESVGEDQAFHLSVSAGLILHMLNERNELIQKVRLLEDEKSKRRSLLEDICEQNEYVQLRNAINWLIHCLAANAENAWLIKRTSKSERQRCVKIMEGCVKNARLIKDVPARERCEEALKQLKEVLGE